MSSPETLLHAGRTPPRGERSPGLVVLARGDGYIVVAKPPRVITHRNWAHPHEYAMLQRVRDLVGGRVWPVHRLDRATSGCQLFATERTLAGPLSVSLAAGQKSYLAFVRGTFARTGTVRVETPIKDEHGLKDAASDVTCLGRSIEPRCSLLHVFPYTGRNHQVRRHVRDLHHPVLRDTYHGDSKVNRWWRDTWGLARLGLHAWSMDLTLPDGAPLSVVCPLFVDQAVLYRRLPWWQDAAAALPGLDQNPIPLVDNDDMVDTFGAAYGWSSLQTPAVPVPSAPESQIDLPDDADDLHALQHPLEA